MPKLYKIGDFSKLLGIPSKTLRKLHYEGKLIPAHITEGGTRYYTEDQLNTFTPNHVNKRINIGYCRVSTSKQSNDLETQVSNVKTYMIAKGYDFEIITDIGSGINYNKPGLTCLIDRICNREVDHLVILYKDRLVRFGFELLEHLCYTHGTTIEIIDNTTKSKEEELTDDLIQIITVFANRLYGSRSKKTKRLIEEVKNNDIR